jgi:hypothetical protein
MTSLRFKRLRQLLWLYFLLLIFEGALRRWFLPGLANPLLLVRDPIALLSLYWGWPLICKPPWRGWLQPLFGIALIAFVLAITVGHGDLFTAIYGCRILVLHIPLIFVFASVFNRDDVIRFSWIFLWFVIPMTVLLVIQSNLPSFHFLNRGVGGVGTAVFAGAAGRFRPPGTFSFISGVAYFYCLSTAGLFSVLYGAQTRKSSRLFCVIASIALVIAVPVSISRSLLAGYLYVFAGLIVSLILSRSRVLPFLSGLGAIFLAIWIATMIPAFQQTSEAFMQRWDSAALSEAQDSDSAFSSAIGVFGKRIIGTFAAPFSNIDTVPILGGGIGIGTNVGSQRLSGDLDFLVGEGAVESTLFELGLPLGLAFMVWRIAFGFWMLQLAIRAAVKGNCLPLIFSGVSFLNTLIGQYGQPTGLGFYVLSAGLTLAACNCGSPIPVSSIIRSPSEMSNLVAQP